MLILSPAEVSTAAMIIEYWTYKVPVAVWITIRLALIVLFNFTSVRYYGETEFWFAFLKIILIFGLIILGIIFSLVVGHLSTVSWASITGSVKVLLERS